MFLVDGAVVFSMLASGELLFGSIFCLRSMLPRPQEFCSSLEIEGPTDSPLSHLRKIVSRIRLFRIPRLAAAIAKSLGLIYIIETT
jgi:hypothetical protein